MQHQGFHAACSVNTKQSSVISLTLHDFLVKDLLSSQVTRSLEGRRSHLVVGDKTTSTLMFQAKFLRVLNSTLRVAA